MMKPLKTSEPLPGIFAISNRQVNFYLVKTHQKYIAFDAGASTKMSLAELNRLHIEPEEIGAVFLTHTDSDHTGGINLFRHAKIFLSKQEESMIDGSTTRMLFMKNQLKYPYETFDDGETIEADGASVRCIVTPGHTKGSTCYLLDGKYLFSGDNFSLKDGQAQLFTMIFNMDADGQKKSIARLAELEGVEAAFTGHHGWTTDFSAAFSHWRR